MKILVITVCLAMIAVQIQRLRVVLITSRVLMLLFWLTVLVWAATSWNWLAIPALVLLVSGVFWDIGGISMVLGFDALASRLGIDDRHRLGSLISRFRVARASPKRLVDFLNHSDYRMRRAAAAEIGNRGDPALVETFLEIVENDGDRQKAALDAIGLVGDVSVADTIVRYLGSDDERMRLHAFGCLARLRAPGSFEPVVNFLISNQTEQHSPAAYRFLSDYGGAAAIGWVWGSVPRGVRLNLISWLRERVKKEDDEAPAVVDQALLDSEGEDRLALEDLKRFILSRTLRKENPSWYVDPDDAAVPVTTEQAVHLESRLHEALGWSDEHDGARLLVRPCEDEAISWELTPQGMSAGERTRRRVFPLQILIGLLVQANQSVPFRFRHSDPRELDEPFDSRPLLQDLVVAMKSGNLASLHVEGEEHGIRSDHNQKLVVDMALARPSSSVLAVRITGWCGPWELDVPPVVGELEIADVFLTPLVEGKADYPIDG